MHPSSSIPPASSACPAAAGARAEPADHPRALLVEDESAERAAFRRLLARAGLSVTEADSAEAALELLQAGKRFDLILSDIKLPGKDGIALLEAARGIAPEVPVLLITGFPTVETAVAATNLGAYKYLPKPIDPDLLLEAVQSAVAMRRLAWFDQQSGSPPVDSQAPIRKRIDAHFDEILEHIWIAFQPIVDWPSRTVFGYEALTRCSHSFVPGPDVLFESADRLKRMHELGRRVRRAIAEALAAAPPSVSAFVNLHPIELIDDELYSDSSLLATFAGRSVLEITERTTLDRVDDLEERVRALRRRGYRIAVDDLGAGYAGLSSFTRLEPDVAKLDMSLVRDVDTAPKKQALVRSMIKVCGDLGLEIVCEGVETEGERDTLTSLGASLMQGYHFARPAPDFELPSGFTYGKPQ